MRISKTNAYWWPVEVEVQEEDGVSKISCELKFQRHRGAEVEQLLVDSGGNDVKICRAVIMEWRSFKDIDGAAFEWNHENFDEALSYPIVAAEFVRAWARSISSVSKKN